MSAHTLRPDVLTFLEQVRGQLDDLSVEEQEELTGGLEADLADLAAESDTPLEERLGDPAAYAAELRSAAGFPARLPRSDGSAARGRGLVARLRALDDAALSSLRRQHWWGPVSRFGAAIRPAWWVLRAVVAVVLIGLFFGGLGLLIPLLLFVVAVVISVELGRGRWSGVPAVPVLVTVGNVFAALTLPYVAAVALGGNDGNAYAEPPFPPPGLVSEGNGVTNVFPYDGQGRPLDGVQLFDQDGRPLSIGPDQRQMYREDGTGYDVLVPALTPNGERWNVFPLRERFTIDPYLEPPTVQTTQPTPPPAPLVAVPPILSPTPTPQPSQAATPESAPPPSPPSPLPTPPVP